MDFANIAGDLSKIRKALDTNITLKDTLEGEYSDTIT